MISACVVWFTLVFRTPIPHAVEDFIIEVLHDSRGSTLALRLPRIPHLYPYYITIWVVCQGVFYIFFRRLGLAPSVFAGLFLPPPKRRPVGRGVVHLPLTPLLYRRSHQKSTGSIAQLWEIEDWLFCSNCLLTNCWGYVIMEIPRPPLEDAALKKPPQIWGGSASLVVGSIKGFFTTP